jgi:two-component system cell cycle response regulator
MDWGPLCEKEFTQKGFRAMTTLLPILVVDDEPEILKSVARDLRRCAQVKSCASPKQALDLFQREEFSVIVSDLKMPEMSGLELLEKCSQVRPECQRILLTAFADLASLTDSINRARLNLILTKPWEPAELASAVEQAQRTNEQLRENDSLRRLALTDSLTGVSNNRYFWERLESELSRAKRYGRPLAVLMADVDDFKRYNDQHGHLTGDRVLRDVAQALDSVRRSMDTVARYGGEEFGMILPEASGIKAFEIAQRLRDSVLEKTQISLSLGVAAYPEHAESSKDLVLRADQALLYAKAHGKAQVQLAR